jgi:heme A synthase
MTEGDRRYARYGWTVLAFTVLVVLWGAFVRASGSGAGCGSHWPLCNGEIIPRSPAVATLIELAHRLSSGVALALVVGLVVAAWRVFPPGHSVRRWAALSGVFMVSEALVGAGLVLLELVGRNTSDARAFWVAGHLVNTFILIACLTLTARWASRSAPPRLPPARPLLPVLVGGVFGVLGIGVSGAVTALGDTLFPVASRAEASAQTFSDTAHFFIRLRVWHPTLALLVGGYLVFASLYAAGTMRRTSTTRLAVALLVLYGTQLSIGILNVWWLAPITLQIVHLLFSDLVWILLILLAADCLSPSPEATSV